MEINRENLEAFREDANKALEEVARKYNVKLHVGKISYETNAFTAQIKCENTTADALKEKNDNLKYFGAKFKIGFKFDDNSREFEVVDVNVHSRVRPIIIQDNRGSQFKASVSFVNGFVPGNKEEDDVDALMRDALANTPKTGE